MNWGLAMGVGGAKVLLCALLGGGAAGCDASGNRDENPPVECDGAPPEVAWAAGAGGSIWQLVDDTWRAQPGPSDAELFALWGTAADSVWAVGAAGTALHFDGATWSQVPTGVDVSLRDVHGSGERDVWAVGDGGVILHWDGGRWSSVEGPSSEDLLTVWTSTPGQAWIGGPTGSLLEWDGDTWRLEKLSTRPMVVKDLAGLSATDLWAVTGERQGCIDSGIDIRDRDGATSQVLHRGMDGWQEEFKLGEDVDLRAVVPLDSDDVWVVGVDKFNGDPTVLRWDGARWSGEEVSGYGDDYYGARLMAVWGINPAQLLSAGRGGLLRRGDRAWLDEGVPGPLNAIWGPDSSRSGCVATCCESLALPDPPEIERSTCAGVACQSGLCDAAAGDGSCWCPEESHADELACVADTPCTGVTCSDVGACVVEGSATRCDCPPGTVDQGGLACAPLPADGNCSADGWCVELPLPIAQVTALWANGSNDVWAVGPGGDVARRTAAGWERVDLGTRMSLVDVSGTGADDVWIAGETAVYHWDGSSLAEVEVDCTAGAYGNQMHAYLGIEAVAPDQVWLLGERHVPNDEPGTQRHVCRFDGRRWHPLRDSLLSTAWGECGRAVQCEDIWTSPGGDLWCDAARLVDGSLVPIPATPPELLWPRDLWAASPDDVWAIDSRELFHWDGSEWTSTGITEVWAIDGVSANDVWATGYQVWHWDGVQWNLVDPGPTTGLVSHDVVVAVGPNEAIVTPRYPVSRLLHYDGSTRTDESLTLPMIPRALWGAEADDLWLGGDYVRGAGTGLSHWNGLTWTAVDVPGLTTVYHLLGFAADDVWAVGTYSDSASQFHSRLARFDGAWTSIASTDLDFGSPVVERDLSRVAGTAADDVWLYGYERATAADDEEPFLAHWNGAAWSRNAAPGLVGPIWPTANEVWVAYSIPVTYQSVISRWDGVQWQDFGPPLDGGVGAIFGFAADDIWAAGGEGLVLHWNGVAWQRVEVGSDANFHGIWGTGGDDIWLSGGRDMGGDTLVGGVLLHFDGSQWSRQQLPTEAHVERVFGVDGEMWTTGNYLLHKR